MDTAALEQRMQQQVQALAQRISRQASPSRQDMAAMERLIYAEADALKAKLLQTWVEAAVDDADRPLCPHCQKQMRQKEQSPKTSSCVGGQVTVKRTRWWCQGCKASFFPSGRDDDAGRSGVDAPGGQAGH